MIRSIKRREVKRVLSETSKKGSGNMTLKNLNIAIAENLPTEKW